jgi:hypothetical protein
MCALALLSKWSRASAPLWYLILYVYPIFEIGNTKLDTSDPTLAAGDELQVLQTWLQASSVLHPSLVERTPSRAKEFRVRSMYQVTDSLSSHASRYCIKSINARRSQVKMEIPVDAQTVPIVLPHEALVYGMLRGYPGIPSCIWSGVKGGAHFLVLDQVGANLEQFRRVCRG